VYTNDIVLLRTSYWMRTLPMTWETWHTHTHHKYYQV